MHPIAPLRLSTQHLLARTQRAQQPSRPLRALRTSLLCIALAGAGAAHALGMNLSESAFDTDPNVDWVQTCGDWPAPRQQPNDLGGTYRIVHASRYAQSFLYIQWLQRDASDSATVVETRGIAELNNDHASISLSQMRCQTTRTGVRFTARAQSFHDDSVSRLTIDAGHKPGTMTYRFVPAKR